MIKQLLSIAFVAGTMAVSAQTNLDFETWASGNPTGWTTSNQLAAGSVTQISSGAGQGSSSVQLTTSACMVCPFIGLPPVFPGLIQQSVASTARPVSVDFLIQADVQSGDEAAFIVQLTKWNGSSTDIIGQAGGTIPGGTTISSWTAQNAPFNYLDPGNPDTLTIVGASSDSLIITGSSSNQVLGSTISLDAIVINSPVGIQNVIFVGASYVAYPNPATSEVTIAAKDEKAVSVVVYDVTGRKVAAKDMNNSKATLSVTEFESGLYIYSVLDANKAVLHTSKFNVAK